MGNAVEMREICVLIFGYLASVDYLKIFGSFAPFVTLIIAFIALKNWQRQDKAKRQAEFLDSLIETAHGLIQEVQGLTLLLETSKIGMKSHELTQPNNVETDTTIRGIIAYVKRHGERDGKRLLERLEISN